MLRFFVWLRILLCFTCLTFASALARAQAATLDAAASAPSGSYVKVQWTGPVEEYDTIYVVRAGAPDTERPGGFSAFTSGRSPVTVLTPEPPGEYELRFVAGKSDVVRARRPLTITPVTATLNAPATLVGGNQLVVAVTGPHNQYDAIAILPGGAPDDAKPGPYSSFTNGNAKVGVLTPEQPGEYEVRYVRGQSSTTLARAKLTITGATASVHGPGTAVSGATISVAVVGPHSQYDQIAVLPAGAPEDAKPGAYSAFTHGNSQVKVRIPEQPGEYEIRYITGGSGKSLASEKLTIGGTTASIKGPGQAPAGESFKVSWKGPGNEYDQIVVAPQGAPEDKWVTYSYVDRSPTTLRAPVELGRYELRYLTGETGTTLARTGLEVVPAKQEPGLLQVAATEHLLSAGGAVEIILDASGSMLQRIGAERRIDIAKQTLTQLTSKVIPAGTPFALRVFGREPKSCQSELDIPLRPLEVPHVTAKVASLEAKSGARTAIAASLDKVAADLKSVKGERLVILITDGEETCGGSPARSIEKLRKNGVNLRVNIVGFAVDDARLAATFRQWSLVGNGAYFDARDAAGLNDALTAAVRSAFEVLDAQKNVVADGLTGGDPVPLMPGTYTVTLKGQKGASQRVSVRAKETARVQF